ncbi:HEXXH motif domain-containing protein [Streptosporangium sp. CA-135522]|uniref:HEXXH motif domain-containing protein n=1 Tax=Streptosporangium sp. CA-135522 TaxID=3240072 RepID=UPI003D94FBAE
MINHHTLPLQEIAHLAAGGGSPEGVAALRRGQLSRNIMLILTVTENAASACKEAYDLLAAAQTADPEAASRVLGHPQTGVRLGALIEDLKHGVDVLSAPLTEIAVAVAIRAGHRFEAKLTVTAGKVMLPTLGLADFGATTDDGIALVRHEDVTTIEHGGTVVTVPADPGQDAPGWYGLRRLRVPTPDGEAEVDLDDVDPYRDRYGLGVGPRLSEAEAARWHRLLGESVELLSRHDPERAAALPGYLVQLVPVPAGANGAGVSNTLQDAYGAVASSPPADAAALAETVIHETQHSKLFALMDLFQLLEDDGAGLHYSPWRDDPRPLTGLLHGAYSFVGVTGFWNWHRTLVDQGEARFAHFQFARHLRQTGYAAGILLASGRLTPYGEAFTKSMDLQLDQWRDAPVPDDVAAWAELTTTDHWLCWRMRNLSFEEVGALASAWTAGHPRPAGPQPQALFTAAEPSALAGRGRMLLLAALLHRPERFDEPDLLLADTQALLVGGHVGEADLALVSGEHSRALAGYLAGIAGSPRDIEQWAGWTLARRSLTDDDVNRVLHDRPELVYRLHLHILEVTGTAPDPESLAVWLA